MKNLNSLIAAVSFLIGLMMLFGCSAPVSIHEKAILSQTDSLAFVKSRLEKDIALLRSQIGEAELKVWQAAAALQSARVNLYRAKIDSVDEFYKYLIYRYRPPLEVSLDRYDNTPFHFPLEPEAVGETLQVLVPWGRIFYVSDFRHLGVDLKAPEGTPVHAIYDGVVRFFGPAWGYGELVVAIEHTYNENWNEGIIPGKFLFIYGHLRSSRLRFDWKPLGLKEGDSVKRGQVIGYINDSENNGHGFEHLHLGVRFQSFAEARATDGGFWLRGYDLQSGSRLKYFYDPLALFGRYVKFVF